jgi:hypothetical protein
MAGGMDANSDAETQPPMNFPPLQPAEFYRLPREERNLVIQMATRGDRLLLLFSMLPVIGASVAGSLTYYCYRGLGGKGFLLPMFTGYLIWGAIFGVVAFRLLYCPRLARKVATELEAMNPATAPESTARSGGVG